MTRSRGFGLRVLLFTLECALGIVVVVLVAALAHWSQWLLPVAVLLYLLIVVPTALLCGFWQAVIVSLSAVAVHSYFPTRLNQSNPVADPTNSVTLVAFVLVALVVSRLSARVTGHAREAESWGGQMRDLYEFTRRTLQMNLHVEPGPQLAELVHDIFALEAVAVFDADLHAVYQAGYWNTDPQELAQNVYYFETADDDPETGLGRRVVRLGTVPIGSLVVRGETSPLTNNAIASLIAITFDRYRAFANESHIEAERRTEQLRATVLDSLAHAYKTPSDRHPRGLDRAGRDGPAFGGAGGAGGADRRAGGRAQRPDHAPVDHGAPGQRRDHDSCHAGGSGAIDRRGCCHSRRPSGKHEGGHRSRTRTTWYSAATVS